ncbi:ROK family protein [Bradyrhizobium sp.]|nr:ROK family protein [Bradyrhizobium sp.]MBV9981899.1 ROK family protein [Bradyrhizobium sp.]
MQGDHRPLEGSSGTHDRGADRARHERAWCHHGAAGAGGEFGHASIDPNGGLCWWGNRGCLELSAGFVRCWSRCRIASTDM